VVAAVADYNAAIQRVVEREGASLVDLHAAGLAARAEGRSADLVSSDGFHPSTAGHARVAQAFAAALNGG
jgi:acyl-CoA thioesterase I